MTEPGHRRAVVTEQRSRWTPYRVGWVGIFALTLAMRVYMLRSWSWLQDDLLLTAWAPTKGFVDYVLTDFAGHVLTGELAIAWVYTTLDPLNYFWPALTIVVFSALVVIAWGLALREIFGERLHLLLALVVINLTPGMTAISLWWISCLNIFPMLASMGFGVWFLARYLLREQSRRDLVGMNVSYALGLLMWEKSLLVTVPLFFLVLLLGPPTVKKAMPLAVRIFWPTAVVTVAYLAFFAWSVHGSDSAGPGRYSRSLGAAAELVQHGTADITLPALLGGPFQSVDNPLSAFPSVPVALAVLLWTLALALAVGGVLLRRRGGVALTMIATYAAISWGLVFFSSRFSGVGAGILAVPRYSADLLPVVLLGCLFLVTPTRVETEPLRRHISPTTLLRIREMLVVYLVLASVVAVVTSMRLWNAVESSSTKPYMDNLVADAQALGKADIYDDVVPQRLVSGILLPDASRTSAILRPLDLPLRYDEPTEQFAMVNDDGHIRLAGIPGGVQSVSPGPDGACGYGVDEGETTSVQLTGQPFAYTWGMEITYFTGSDARIAVQTDTDRLELTMPVTSSGGVGKRQFLISGPISALTIEGLDGTSAVCITELRVGNFEATDQVPAALAKKTS